MTPQDYLRNHAPRDRSGHVMITQADAERIANRIDELEALLLAKEVNR